MEVNTYVRELADNISRAREAANKALMKTQEKSKIRYDQKHPEKSYLPGDLVWLNRPTPKKGLSPKLMKPSWKGPDEIIEKTSQVNYNILQDINGKIYKNLVHINRLKSAFGIDKPTTKNIIQSKEARWLIWNFTPFYFQGLLYRVDVENIIINSNYSYHH